MAPEHDPSQELDKHARNEAWLGEQLGELDEHPAADRDMLKEQVRITLHESWLADQVSDRLPHGLADRVKAGVRHAIVEEFPETTSGRANSWRWAGAIGLAAAACLAFIMIPRPASTGSNPDEPEWLATFDRTQDSILASLEELDDDLADLELTMADVTYDDSMDDMLDDLLLEMDDMLTDEDWG
ncbi:MAG: hypothetical protein ACYTHJ_12805 [Planctomycetota bacterium]|jgi:hypothetical protein